MQVQLRRARTATWHRVGKCPDWGVKALTKLPRQGLQQYNFPNSLGKLSLLVFHVGERQAILLNPYTSRLHLGVNLSSLGLLGTAGPSWWSSFWALSWLIMHHQLCSKFCLLDRPLLLSPQWWWFTAFSPLQLVHLELVSISFAL